MPTLRSRNSILYLLKAIVLTTIVISILCYVDYITGEISIDILYICCLLVVTWYTNIFIGLLCVLEIVMAKLSADYFDHIKIGSHQYEWNTLNNIFIYLIVCILASRLKKVLTE
jgi:hypothetical protein